MNSHIFSIKSGALSCLARLIFLFLPSLAYSQTDCTSANIGIYDSKGVFISSHAQSYKAEVAAVLLSQKEGKSTVKTPDIVCITQATAIVPFYRTTGTTWIPGSVVNVSAGAQIELGPQPYTGSWSWSGCGVTGSVREQTVRPSASCKIVATHTNICGTKSTHEFSINVGSASSSSSRASSSSASTVIVSWQHPTRRENGKDLALSEIGGYEIRQGSASYKIAGNQITQRQIPNSGGKLEIAAYDTLAKRKKVAENFKKVEAK